MRLINLNTWGGNVGQPLLDFFSKYAQQTDVFLLQEVFSQGSGDIDFTGSSRLHLFEDLSAVLADSTGYFAPAQANEWGLASFIKKDYKVDHYEDFFVHRHRDAMIGLDGKTLGKNIQYFKIIIENKIINLINFHGLWNGQGKGDSDDRLNQSKKLIDFVKNLPGELLIAGDFNLSPDTASLKLITDSLKLKNLISEYGVSSTRTSFYEKPNRFADYILVSEGIKVANFQVLPDEVSDHAALSINFEI